MHEKTLGGRTRQILKIVGMDTGGIDNCGTYSWIVEGGFRGRVSKKSDVSCLQVAVIGNSLPKNLENTSNYGMCR